MWRPCWASMERRLRAAYAASKGAVVLLTKCMAIDHGLRENSSQCDLPVVCGNRPYGRSNPQGARPERSSEGANRSAPHRPPGPAGRHRRTRCVSRKRRIVLGHWCSDARRRRLSCCVASPCCESFSNFVILTEVRRQPNEGEGPHGCLNLQDWWEGFPVTQRSPENASV